MPILEPADAPISIQRVPGGPTAPGVANLRGAFAVMAGRTRLIPLCEGS
jgi:hypothetical protein